MREHEIQNAIINTAQSYGFYPIRLNSGVAKVDKRTIRLCPAGTPDLMIVLPAGRVLFVEVKKDKKEKLRDTQIILHDKLRSLGHIVYVAKGLWGIKVLTRYFTLIRERETT
jgi:hypothetical protein